MLRNRSRVRRGAFTLIELMMVIAIIAVLVALLLAGVVRVFQLAQRTETKTDIDKMTSAFQTAMSEQNYRAAKFLPSPIILINNTAVYRNPTMLANAPYSLTGAQLTYAQLLTVQTANTFRNMFGKRFIQSGGIVTWTGKGQDDYKVLTHSECLVFYLGGMPVSTGTANTTVGFSRNPTDPTAAGGERIGPFYEFRSGRLVVGPSGAGFQYLDPYNKPYIYFGPAGVNRYFDPAGSALAETIVPASGGNPAVVFYPYYDSNQTGVAVVPPPNNARFLAPNGFQLISAGKDNDYGPGGPWNPLTGSGGGRTADNLSNFSQLALGDPQG